MQRTSPVHYINPSVISIIPNANNSVSDLAVHITNDAKIKVYSNGIQQLSYNEKGNFQEWTIAGLNRRLTADINSVAKVPYTIYARLLRDDKTKGYLIFTPQRQQGNEWIDKYPYVTNDGLSKTYYGTPSNQYWYIRLGEVTVPVDGKRTVELDTGILGTDLYNSEWNFDPDQMPLRIDIVCTIDGDDAGPKPYVPWGKTLVLSAGLLEGWATTDVERFDHWTITRNSGLSDADLIWNLSHAASFSKTGTIVLTHARGRGDDFGGSVSTLFTIAAWEKNDAYDPEDDLSEEPEFLQMTQASVNIMAETVEKFELSLSTNIVGYNPQTEMYNPGSGVDIRIRATDQRSDVFDLTGAQFTNAQLQVSWATVDSDTWTNVSFEGTPTAVAVGNISVDAFAAQKSIVVRLTRQIGTVEHPDTMELTRATVAYVRDGEDSRDREWIFIRTLLPDNYGTLPSLINVGEVNPEGHAAGGSTPYDATLDEWVPQGWWDEQQGVDEVHLYEYGSYRDYIRDDEGEGGQWGQFTRPRIWGHWGDDAVTYDIVPDVSVINADSKGNVTSDGIVVRAYRTKGAERSSNILPDPDIPQQGDYYMAEYSIDGKPWTACAKFLHLEETSGGEKITVYRYGVESSVVKTSKETVSFRLKHTSDTTVTLKETTPIKVLRIITEEEAEELIEQYGKKLFLSKIDDDTAEGLITLLNGIQVGYRYTPDIFGEGGVFRMNADGKVELVTDILYTRVKAYFDNVEIRDYQHTSGNRIASQAQGFKCSRVEWYDSNNNVIEQTVANRSNVAYFRCYWRVDDGQKKTDNQFIIGDLAFCQSAEVTNDSLVTNRFWRLVIGRNEGTTTTEKGEAWIDLSNAHNANGTPKMTTITWEGQGGVEQSMQALSFEAGSGFPMAEDDICQLGDVRDATRQGAIIEYVSGIDSPTYQIYQDIGSDATNPYSLNNKNYIGLGYNTATGRAYMNVYGDMYIGAKPDPQTGVSPTFIEYKQDDGTQQHKPSLKIKAYVEFTNPDSELDSFVQEHQNNYDDSWIQPALDAIQEQIDGELDTWYYAGVPTLNNAPANTWTTDQLKNDHVGDLYYDKNTGYAYRFLYDDENEIYYWTQIHDDAISEALRIASEAQDTADNKRRVFICDSSHHTPTPPYDKGDLWVNVKYPWATGATYNNEILKCAKAKTSGQSFAIGDWSVANGYTEALKNFVDNTYAPFVTNIQGQVDGKAETWRQATNPANSWSTDAEKAKHVGDLWMDTSANGGNKTYIYVDNGASASIRYAWVAQEVPDVVFDEIDSKASIFVIQPSNYKANDLWILSANTTVNGVAYKKGEVLTSSADSATYVASHWSKKLRYTDDTKYNGFITALLNGMPSGSDEATVEAALNAIKAALNQGTTISGGLVLSTLIGLRDSNSVLWAGISGQYTPSALGKGIAAWFGGAMADMGNMTTAQQDTWDAMTDQQKAADSTWSKTLFRFDGSGYLAANNIYWNAAGAMTIKNLDTIQGTAAGSTVNINTLSSITSIFHTETYGTGSTTELLVKPQNAFSQLFINRTGTANTSTVYPQNHTINDWSVLNYGEMKERFVPLDFFNALFTAFSDSAPTSSINPLTWTPSTVINNLKVNVGLWTQQYLSALGQNSSGGGGGGGGATTLDALNDVAISNPTNGQVLKYNSTTGKWYNGTDSGVTSVAWSAITGKPSTISGYGISDAYISNGTITIGSNSITPITSLSGYATQSWVNTQLGSYLPLAGGTLTGGITLSSGSVLLKSGNFYLDFDVDTSRYRNIQWRNSSLTKVAEIGYHNTGKRIILNSIGATDVWTDTNTKYSFIVGNNELTYNTYKVWHSGNVTASMIPDLSGSYLPLTGGTLSGNLGITKTSGRTSIFLTNSNGGSEVAYFAAGKNYSMYFGIGSGNVNRGIYDTTNNKWAIYFDANNTILNYGNVGIGTTTPVTKLDVNGGVKGTKFYLSKPNAGNDTNAIYFELDSNNAVHLVGAGFYTDSFVSALGLNSSGGGGGGVTRLDALSDVAISDPTNGQVLKYNSSTGKWYNGTDSGVTSVAWSAITGKPSTISGYGISDAYISNGTITIGSNSITPTDTKNTAGSTNTSSKIFLIGATSQAANPQTYSHDTAYVGTDGCLYSGGTKVLTAHQSLSNYVTLNSAQTISATKTFSVQQAFTVAQGTAPFTVASTTKVTNLNADLLDGYTANNFYHKAFSEKKFEPSGTSLAGWYRVAQFTEAGSRGISFLLSIYEKYNNGAPNPATFIINVGSKAVTIRQLGAGVRTPTHISAIRVVGNSAGATTYYLDLYYTYSSTTAYNTQGFNLMNLGNSNSQEYITLVDWTSQPASDSLPSGEILYSSVSVSTTFNADRATQLQTARTLWGQSFDGSGNVDGKMAINYDGSTAAELITLDAPNATYNCINYRKPSGGSYSWSVGINKDHYYFYNGKMAGKVAVIDNDGNVGIGTTTPTNKLDVNGTIGLLNSGTQYGTISVLNTSIRLHADSGNYVGIRANGSDASAVAFASTGVYPFSAGAGTYSLGLSSRRWGGIYGTTLNLPNGSSITMQDNNGTDRNIAYLASNNALVIGEGTRTVGSTILYGNHVYIRYGTSGSNTGIYLSSSGDVGIGTTEPAYKFDVSNVTNGTAAWTGRFFGENTVDGTTTRSAVYLAHGNGQAIYMGTNYSTNDKTFVTFQKATTSATTGSGGSPALQIRGDGRVLINNYIATCSTAVGTKAKTATINGYTLESGMVVRITFTNGNTNTAATLNISSTGAKTIRQADNTALTGTTIAAGDVVDLQYDGTYYKIIGINQPYANGCYLWVNGVIKSPNYIYAQTATSFSTAVVAENINRKIGILAGTNGGVYDYKTSTWLLATNGTSTWLSQGNVGIGNTSPSYKLHVTGDIYATGAVSCLSDERFKDIKGETALSVEQIAQMPSIKYTWKDGREDKDVHVGSIAQRWMTILPEVVMRAKDENGTLSINYGVAAMIASITTARKVVDHERRIKELEKENMRLRTEVEQLIMKGA